MQEQPSWFKPVLRFLLCIELIFLIGIWSNYNVGLRYSHEDTRLAAWFVGLPGWETVEHEEDIMYMEDYLEVLEADPENIQTQEEHEKLVGEYMYPLFEEAGYLLEQQGEHWVYRKPAYTETYFTWTKWHQLTKWTLQEDN